MNTFAQNNQTNETKNTLAQSTQGAGRVPIGQGSLSAGAISPMTCPADGPPEGPHKKDQTEDKTRKGQIAPFPVQETDQCSLSRQFDVFLHQ